MGKRIPAGTMLFRPDSVSGGFYDPPDVFPPPPLPPLPEERWGAGGGGGGGAGMAGSGARVGIAGTLMVAPEFAAPMLSTLEATAVGMVTVNGAMVGIGGKVGSGSSVGQGVGVGRRTAAADSVGAGVGNGVAVFLASAWRPIAPHPPIKVPMLASPTINFIEPLNLDGLRLVVIVLSIVVIMVIVIMVVIVVVVTVVAAAIVVIAGI